MARQISIEIFLILGIGLVMGLFGPFGTFETQAPTRILFWVVFILVGYGIFRPITVVGKWVASALGLPEIVGIGMAQVIAAVPLTFLIALLFAGFDAGKALRADGLGMLYFDVWLVGFLINGFFVVAFREKGAPLPPSIAADEPPVFKDVQASAPAPQAPVFLDRLPKGFGPLLALKGEDHYVRAFGGAREELILLRLRDAVAELGATDGMQVHRSWWVARAAVASVKRDGRSATLHLTNGTEVPVARDKLADIKRAGWR